MQALVYDGALRVDDVPMPQREDGEALIKVLTAGICNTDLEITQGYMGFEGILGHEFVGVVEEAANSALIGKRVVGEINCIPPKCPCEYCAREMPNHCLNRKVLGILNHDGAFAEYLTLPEENLHLAPSSVKDDVAVFTEPVAAAFRITEQIIVNRDDRVIVLGDGKLGQLIAQVLWLYSKNLVCVGRREWKLNMLQHLGIGAAHVDEPIERGADIVVEVTGSEEGLARALELVRPEGKVVLKTTVGRTTAMDLSLPVINEVDIIGSRCGPFKPALEALSLGNVEVRPMITETWDLRDGVKAMARAADPNVMKVLLHM